MKCTRFFILALAVFLFVFGSPGSARANCTNPAGIEGAQVYNTTYHTMQFCNGTAWISMGGGASGGLTPISTQTASASASLQFTNLPTSYNTLFLNCAGLLTSIGTAGFNLVVGEGAGPTWETGAHYTVANLYANNATPASFASTTSVDLTANGNNLSTTVPASIKLNIDNVNSSTLYKMSTWTKGVYASSSLYITTGTGYWNNDTNPVTGIEVLPSSGNIASGTCSLYGMN